jgi:hypothetical protein
MEILILVLLAALEVEVLIVQHIGREMLVTLLANHQQVAMVRQP